MFPFAQRYSASFRRPYAYGPCAASFDVTLFSADFLPALDTNFFRGSLRRAANY